MTLLKPGMKAAYRLPDGSTYELDVAKTPQPDEAPPAAQPLLKNRPTIKKIPTK